MQTIIREHSGWAINTRSKENHCLIGTHWVFNGRLPVIGKHMAGYRIAVFETRDAARLALADVKRTFPRARVERVTVSISVDTPR